MRIPLPFDMSILIKLEHGYHQSEPGSFFKPVYPNPFQVRWVRNTIVASKVEALQSPYPYSWKILAIKAVRAKYGWGLKQSKDVVEAIEAKYHL